MSAVTSGVSSVINMLGTALTFVTDQPLLLALILLPLAGGLLGIIFAMFRK